MQTKIYYVSFLLLILVACSKELSRQEYEVPEGMVQVDLRLAGVYNNLNPFSKQTQSLGTRSGEVNGADSETLKDKKTYFLPDGTTLWILVEKIKDESGDPVEEEVEIKSYIVRSTEGGAGSSLYPCEVNDDGTPKLDENNSPIITDSPFFLEFGTYLFTAVSPARKLEDNNGLLVRNGEYLISTDNRYTQTQQTEVEIKDEDKDLVIVTLNPLINQTAQLKFTLYVPEDDMFVHDLDIMPAGVTIFGLQDHYTSGNELWNWQLNDTLVMAYGKKTESYTQYTMSELMTVRLLWMPGFFRQTLSLLL